MVICPHCKKETPGDQNYCINCGGALKYSARVRGLWARAKTMPAKAKTKSLAMIGGGPKVAGGGATTQAQPKQSWFQKRKAAKAGAQPASGSSVSGITGWAGRAATSQTAKQAGKYGLWIGLVLLLVGFLFIGLIFIGSFFTLLPLYMLIIGIGILLFIVLLFKGSAGKAVACLIIFIAIGYLAFWLQYTTTGHYYVLRGQEFSIGSTEEVRAVTGPLMITKQIFTGEYNPEYLWRSDQVESQYDTVKDVGITLVSATPLKDQFSEDEFLTVQGRINAVAFPGQTSTAFISAACAETVGVEKCNGGWTCNPKVLNIAQIRNRYFSCTSDEKQKEGVWAVEISTKAQDTMTIAGKQFVFANPEVAVTLANPLSTWDISSDSLQSWQKGDESLNVGLGIAGDPEWLEAGTLEYHLGVNVENPSSNAGTASVTSVLLFMPTSIIPVDGTYGEFYCTIAAKGDPDFPKGIVPSADLRKCSATIGGDIPTAERQVAFLKFNIPLSTLNNTDFSTFFAFAIVKYNYVNTRLLSLEVAGGLPTGRIAVTPVPGTVLPGGP